MKASDCLQAGEIYGRAQLAKLFDVHDPNLNNGVFRPKGYDSIWLFITEHETPDRLTFDTECDPHSRGTRDI